MPKKQAEKKEIIDQIAKLLESKSLVFSTFYKTKVGDQAALRSTLREAGVNLMIVKKTLLKKALAKKGMELPLVDQLFEQIAVAATTADELAPAKVLVKASKGNKELKIYFGLLDGRVIEADSVKTMASLPGREPLLAQAVGALNAPLHGLVQVLVGTERQLLNVLNQIRERK